MLYLIGICPEDEGRILKKVSSLFDLIEPGSQRFVERCKLRDLSCRRSSSRRGRVLVLIDQLIGLTAESGEPLGIDQPTVLDVERCLFLGGEARTLDLR